MKKSGLVDLLKKVIAQYKALQATDSGSNLQFTVQTAESIMDDDTLARMEDLSKIRSAKTNKSVLKNQLELYRQLVPDIPPSDQLEKKKRQTLLSSL